ncbi:hypothetical protein SBRCBS47491_000923 [Sporothrix bragantina]|uniref:Complex 1 LYR protein domain-containing protein n=1 Tax=Sporothrix bragantina TaxID=671064 RepID=A0ABP0AUB6_9PEZI
MPPPAPRLSGLQREVLSLYRQCLRACRQKPDGGRARFEEYVRNEFVKHRDLEKRDFGAIEYLLRKGRRQLEVMSSSWITDIR